MTLTGPHTCTSVLVQCKFIGVDEHVCCTAKLRTHQELNDFASGVQMKGCAESTASLWRGMTSGAPTVQSLPSSEQQMDPRAEKEKLIQASKPTFAVPSDLPSD